MAATDTFHEVEGTRAYNGLVQDMSLEPNKQVINLKRYLDDLLEYLYRQMDKVLRAIGRGVLFWESAQVNYNQQMPA